MSILTILLVIVSLVNVFAAVVAYRYSNQSYRNSLKLLNQLKAERTSYIYRIPLNIE